MAKLYPPYIEGTLPAFCLDGGGNGTITIPFELNKAVSEDDIKGVYVKVKTVQNDVLITSLSAALDEDKRKAMIQVTGFKATEAWTLNIGQYYKLQLAFVDNTDNEIGYYSTVGVIKCTSKPELSIVGFDKNSINNNNRVFVGQFVQAKGGDVTEKVYSSRFVITDSEGNEIINTGDMLHNVENNPNSYTSTDTLVFNRDLELGEVYTITYTVTTNNGLVESVSYLLEQPQSIETAFKGELTVSLNKDEGYIEIGVGGDEIADGAFLLSRSDNLDPTYWAPLTEFALQHEKPDDKYGDTPLFRDFTIEQGKTYTYSIQQYNKYNIYSDRIKSDAIYADFDDMFLYDGERQLKLQFNPQVSSFKTQLAETRTETIGSKYPFFFRNARVGYKTFPISGLVSMFTDENEWFLKYEDILREDLRFDRHSSKSNKKEHPEDVYDQHWEIDHDFVSERLFKMKVLDWFNDGKVKLFKSPGEGNFLVRLMDTSLTPQTALGRMLHTINATAYECAECNYEMMLKYGIIENVEDYISAENAYVTNWDVISLSSLLENQGNSSNSSSDEIVSGATLGASIESPFEKNDLDGKYYWGLLDPMIPYITDVHLEDFMPGTKVRFVFTSDRAINSGNYVDIVIGATGSYMASDIKPIYQIYLLQDNETLPFSGSITYMYQAPTHTEFDLTKSTISKLGSYRQFVGETNDIVNLLTSQKDTVTALLMANFKKRPVEYLFYKNDDDVAAGAIYNGYNDDGYRKLKESYQNKWYWDSSFTKPFTDKDNMEHSPFGLYVLINSVDGVKIFGHEKQSNVVVEDENDNFHTANHMFEKYYIDRHIAQDSAEDVVIDQSLLKGTLYVLDPWVGRIYTSYTYSPTITYNNQEINLREIERYDLDGLDPETTTLSMSNGVYGEVFYNKIEKTYSVEDEPGNEVYTAKFNYTKKINNYGYTLKDEAERDELYATFDAKLAAYIKEWTEGHKEEEEEPEGE